MGLTPNSRLQPFAQTRQSQRPTGMSKLDGKCFTKQVLGVAFHRGEGGFLSGWFFIRVRVDFYHSEGGFLLEWSFIGVRVDFHQGECGFLLGWSFIGVRVDFYQGEGGFLLGWSFTGPG